MQEVRGAHTYSEIMSQPEVWPEAVTAFKRQAETLRRLWQENRFDQIILTGCGSTHYLAVAGAALMQSLTRVPTRAHPASEVALFPDTVLIPDSRTLLITVSRSGATTETIEAVRVFHERTGGLVVTVTCDDSSTLAQQSNLVLAINAAQEKSLAQTRSFSSMMIVVQAMAALFAGWNDFSQLAGLAPLAQRLLSEYHDLARQLGENPAIDRFFFLGSGPLNGIASEAMLKMKEMSLSYSEAYHTLEFRHGPMSMVNEQTLVAGLISDDIVQQEAAVLRQMRQRGARILATAEADYRPDLPDGSHVVPLASGLPLWARPVLYLPVLQLLAYYRAMAQGRNPDKPANLTAVISLDPSMM